MQDAQFWILVVWEAWILNYDQRNNIEN